MSKPVSPQGLSHGPTSLLSFFIFWNQAVGGWEQGSFPSAGPRSSAVRRPFSPPPILGGPGLRSSASRVAIQLVGASRAREERAFLQTGTNVSSLHPGIQSKKKEVHVHHPRFILKEGPPISTLLYSPCVRAAPGAGLRVLEP